MILVHSFNHDYQFIIIIHWHCSGPGGQDSFGSQYMFSIFITWKKCCIRSNEHFVVKVNHGRMSENEARRYFQQLINAVDYCHSRGVYHRDLKVRPLCLSLSLSYTHTTCRCDDDYFEFDTIKNTTSISNCSHTFCSQKICYQMLMGTLKFLILV